MPHDAIVFASIATTLVASVIVIALVGSVMRARRQRLRPEEPTMSLQSERLTRLEQAVEAIALEVERIGEGQRYLVRLQASKAVAARELAGTPNNYRTMSETSVTQPMGAQKERFLALEQRRSPTFGDGEPRRRRS